MNRTIARRKRKLKSTELLSSTDPVRIKVDRSFPFKPSSMGGKVELKNLKKNMKNLKTKYGETPQFIL